jgi:hypothetical protein
LVPPLIIAVSITVFQHGSTLRLLFKSKVLLDQLVLMRPTGVVVIMFVITLGYMGLAVYP